MECYLIYSLVTAWNEPPRSRHQVAFELAKKGVVYFAERNIFGLPKLCSRQLPGNIVLLTPYFWLPYKLRYRLPFINNWYQRWLQKKISKLYPDISVVINFDYTATGLNRYFKKIIFYCADDNVGFGKFNPGIINRYHQRSERTVAEQATICIATSEYMHQKIGRYNSNTFLVTLGAPSIDMVPTFARNERKLFPVLCLVGYLDSNLDYPLLSELLAEHKIVFIGPVNKKNAGKLKNSKNAIFAGIKTGRDLYSAVAEADVCIAPYDVNVLNKGATPNKLWLYLSLGKPVVVTNMPNINNWIFDKGTVYTCSNNEFMAACKEAYNSDNPGLMERRLELARENSWQNKVDEILYHLETVSK